MRVTSSLRWKIALTTTAVCCTVAAVLGILVHNVVAGQVVGEVRKDVGRDLEDAVNQYQYGTVHGDVHVVIDPPDLPGPLRGLVARGETGSMVGEHDGEPAMWGAGPADTKVLAVWLPFDQTRRRLRDLDTAILASAALAAGIVALAGLFLADRISRRLATTAAVARRISAGDLDARVGLPADPDDPRDTRHHDEVRDVAHALDSMAGSLQERLEAEKRFTADVAHELRTPLTGSLAAASLLPEGRPKEMINDRLRALHLLTEDLLEISRLDAGVEQAELSQVELGRAVRRAVAGTRLPVSVRVVRDTVVLTDRRRLDRILANLLVNADKHGKPPIEVSVEGPVVVIHDHGAGYPPELIEQGPQRFRTGDPGRGRGHGLGLTIAVGQAAVLEVELTFANAPDGGAQTTLRLPVGRLVADS
ncbi:HAMP domain-containing histidine kinase [Streptomyces sp. NBC_00513]|uniref:sensor histidine kinase n=1 Tax=unclassified Streptomyces TaxID=2593676 RepID=UPI00224F6FD2|nr:HAMP domain-containing sensor histidine kinase [Streptomyces sp. NBC_00424]MCX5074577.1 HAMP domain-containing histidine kinase [Streptomyces sp. NBC_00424]WUD42246.1 HAMP domain-containing histidine kinase [Streptomyces sp. NBC_00513]